MSVAGITSMGRAAAERLMTDTVAIVRVTGESFNDSTGSYDETTESVYSGKARLKVVPQAFAEELRAGERIVSTMQFVMSIPMSVTGVQVDDRVTFTASPQDSGLVGRSFRVRQEVVSSHLTARRLMLDEEQT